TSMKNKKGRYSKIATELIAAVGGEENIEKVMHCVTRLRFYLKNEAAPSKDEVENINGVMGVVKSGGQYQVIVGEAVDDIYKEVATQLPFTETVVADGEAEVHPTEDLNILGKMKYWFNQ